MLHLQNIKYEYKNSLNTFCVEIPNLEFKEGIISAILGKNGSGKTTLLNIIGGHLMVENGKIELDNENITSQSTTKRKTSTVFQTIALFPHLSVKENILLAIEPNSFGKHKQASVEKVNNILQSFNLTTFVDRKPNQLSIGQQQRVAIARATATEPKVLLLDEPTSALDFENIAYLKKLLQELVHSNKIPVCIIVSHDLPFVLNLADEIKYIETGKLVFEGTSNDFKNSKFYIN